MNASKILKKKYNVNNAVLDLKKVKPLNSLTLKKFIKSFSKIFIVEEHYSSNGAGAAITEWLANEKKLIDSVVSLGIKNEFIHGSGSQSSSREMAGISANKIVKRILKKLK